MLGYAHPQVERRLLARRHSASRWELADRFECCTGSGPCPSPRSIREAVEACSRNSRSLARSGDPVALLTAHANAGLHAFFSGDFEQCLSRRMTEATRWYSTAEHSAFLQRHGMAAACIRSPIGCGRCRSSAVQTRPAAAAEELQTLAEQSATLRPGDRRRFLDQPGPGPPRPGGDARSRGASDRYAQRQMLPFWEGPAHCSRGWARVCLRRGRRRDRRDHAWPSVSGRRRSSRDLPLSPRRPRRSLLMAGAERGGAETTERGLSMCETLLDRFYEAELMRLQAEAHRRLGDLESAESGFDARADLARRHRRHCSSCARPRVWPGARIESGRSRRCSSGARISLSGLSESLDTTDVRDARELLREIA